MNDTVVLPHRDRATEPDEPDSTHRAERLRLVRRLRAGRLPPPARRHVQDRRPALRLAQGDVHRDAAGPPAWDRPAARRTSGLACRPQRARVRRLPPRVGRGRRRALPARHPRPPARDGQGELRRSLRTPRALRRRRGALPRHHDRRVERLDRDPVQLDPRAAGSARSPTATSASSPATRSGPRRS